MDRQKDDGGIDSHDFLRLIKEDLFDEEVFVFAPNVDVVCLYKKSPEPRISPAGSTPRLVPIAMECGLMNGFAPWKRPLTPGRTGPLWI